MARWLDYRFLAGIRIITETYIFRTAEPADRAAVFELYALVMRGYVSEIWGWDQAWQEREFVAHFEPSAVTLVCRGLDLVGYCQVEDRTNELFVHMIVIHPDHQCRGIGTRLLESVIASGRQRSKDIWLEVFKINIKARILYRRLGFRVVGETPSSYAMRLKFENSICLDLVPSPSQGESCDDGI